MRGARVRRTRLRKIRQVANRRHCAAHGVEHVASAFATERSRVCKKATRARLRSNARATRLMKVYGLTLEDYERLLAAQGGKCAGCGGTRKYNLHVDHDHKLEAEMLARGEPALWAARCSVRGLLCARCNKILRDARDSVPTLRRLASYVLRPPAQKVLR